jgi:c-di-GMP-binding flagellar brake protein YcgR
VKLNTTAESPKIRQLKFLAAKCRLLKMVATMAAQREFMEQQRLQETRRYERFPCAQMVTIRSVDDIQGAEEARALVVDVSLGGLKMRTKASLDPSKTYILTMAATGIPMNFHGTVVHLAQSESDGETGVGFVFRPESHDERVAIANFVHQVFSQAWHAEAA